MPITSLGDLAPHTWFKADGTVLKTISGSVAAVNNDTVERWSDMSGNGHHADQATSTKRPTFLTGQLNSLPTIRADGVDDFLRTTSWADEAQPNTVVAVAVAPTIDGNLHTLLSGVANLKRHLIRISNATNAWAMSAPTVVDDGVAVAGVAVIVVVFDGASSKIRVNGVETTGNPGAEPLSGLTLFGNNPATPTQLWNKDLAEVGFFTTALSAGDIADIETHLNAKWVTAGGPQTVTLGLALEDDSAFAPAVQHAATIGLAQENDSGFAPAAAHALTLGLGQENDAALAPSMAHALTLGLAEETDTAAAATLQHLATLGLATETDDAQPPTLAHAVALGLAQELDSGLTLSLTRLLELGLAVETDEGFDVTIPGHEPVGVNVRFRHRAEGVRMRTKAEGVRMRLSARGDGIKVRP